MNRRIPVVGVRNWLTRARLKSGEAPDAIYFDILINSASEVAALFLDMKLLSARRVVWSRFIQDALAGRHVRREM